MKILFITLSNIGDVILTLPVLDSLKEKYPHAQITALVGPRAKEILENSLAVHSIVVFDKQGPLKEKARLFNALRKEHFDLIIDLRNSLWGFLFGAKSRRFIKPDLAHMRDKHLLRAGFAGNLRAERTLRVSPADETYIQNILEAQHIQDGDKIVVVSAGARSHIKRWRKEEFVRLLSSLIKEFGVKVCLVGDKDDIPINKYIIQNLSGPVIDLSAKTNLSQLAGLLKKAKLIITNDSAVMHLASYLDLPLVAIFGPTDETRYGPWSSKYLAVKKELFCRPCSKAQCKFGTLACMQFIKAEDVLKAIRDVLAPRSTLHAPRSKGDFKRILIARTDRIGDVLLSTPVIRALREAYPYAYIAMMVSPYTKEIVEGNPYLDEVIIYDKDGKHKSWPRSMRFALRLKKKHFDLALILHPTNRLHLLTFFAGIRRRVGYNRKLGFLLTDRLEHTKQLGQKHELEYNFDLLRYLGIDSDDQGLFIPIKPESERWVKQLLKEEGISQSDKLLAIHPGASCPSKIWPQERFAEVADRLSDKYGFKVAVVAGPKDISLAQNVIKYLGQPALNLAGKISLSQLASFLKRCSLFISNDSGPVHIACAVDTPVISIFGRSQQGLGPRRWGPVGKNDRVAQKKVGCVECLAHNCPKGFVCLKAVTVDYVLNLADAILTLEKGARRC